MSTDFLYRTEDIVLEDVSKYFVEIPKDRDIIEKLKSANPIVLVGSRGVGKSLLLRMAQSELLDNFEKDKIFPVYVSFNKSSLIHTSDPQQFQHWMLAKISNTIIRDLRKRGILKSNIREVSILSGGSIDEKTPIELVEEKFVESWKNPGTDIDVSMIPSIDDFKNVLEDLCDNLGIKRFCFFIDEAAHIFIPEQQRMFFTLFRDLRSPYTTCNAAVYPGVTSYGDIFQPNHDATFVYINRNITDIDYLIHMKDIVLRQSSQNLDLINNIEQQGQIFNVLAFASDGNPRILLKTVGKLTKFNSSSVSTLIREFYRIEMWRDHSDLAEKYPGHAILVDWGRKFIEKEVLTRINDRNIKFKDKEFTYFFLDTSRRTTSCKRSIEITRIYRNS